MYCASAHEYVQCLCICSQVQQQMAAFSKIALQLLQAVIRAVLEGHQGAH